MIRLTRRTVLLGATALSFAGFVRPGAAQDKPRTNHALLVACTAYPNLPPRASLKGPNNDAKLVRTFLATSAPVPFKPEDIILLADGLDGAATSPTHKNILDSLASIAAKANSGDFVYIHLSGHGSQQPALIADDETDGLDEIFLPADTSPWLDKTKGVPNALMDNQIGGALDAIRAKGAFVWFVIDACNSGTATRAAPVDDDTVTDRKLDPAELGIPDEAMAEAGSASRSAAGETKPPFALGETTSGTGRGGMVAFYAAQSVETTPEMPLPKGAKDAVKFGLFTFTIFSKIAENPNMSYRQLGHAVLQQYSADARQRPTPLFEGDLDARVFGTEATSAVLQWPIVVKDGAVTVAAGLLQRVSPGSRLAILAGPADETSAALGYLEVSSAETMSSQLTPVSGDNGKPAMAIDAIPAQAYARLVDSAVDFALVVARPAPADGLDKEVALANQTLDTLAAVADKRFKFNLVAPGQDADIRLAVMRENAIGGAAADATDQPALWFLSSSGDIEANGQERPPLVAIDLANPQKLADATAVNLEKIYRAVGLARLAASMDAGVSDVSLEFSIKRLQGGTMEPLQASTVPSVSPDDQVHVVATNSSTKHVDVNILYVGSDYSISQIGRPERLAPGATLKKGLLRFDGKSYGLERMVAVMTEASAQSALEDLKYLEQGGVPAVTRELGGGPKGLKALLGNIAQAPSTRAAVALEEESGQSGAVMIFPMRNLPRT